MDKATPIVMAAAMVAALLLIAGGVKLLLRSQTRGRGILMIAAIIPIARAVEESIFIFGLFPPVFQELLTALADKSLHGQSGTA